MKEKNRKRNSSGFTIVEILVVVIIIAVLASMIAPKFFRHIGQAKQSVAKNNIIALESAIDIFSVDYGRLPENLEELVTRPADIAEEKWQTPSIKAKDLIDPWERQYLYKQPGDNGPYDLYSLGKDGQESGKDEDADIVNW